MQISTIRQERCLSGEEGSIVWPQEQKKVVLPSASDSHSQKVAETTICGVF